jgi:hypothetical protein
MRADYLRLGAAPPADLGETYRALTEEYDRGGLPWERALTRLSHARWLLARGEREAAAAVNTVTLDLARRHGMRIIEADALEVGGRAEEAWQLRRETGYAGAARP